MEDKSFMRMLIIEIVALILVALGFIYLSNKLVEVTLKVTLPEDKYIIEKDIDLTRLEGTCIDGEYIDGIYLMSGYIDGLDYNGKHIDGGYIDIESIDDGYIHVNIIDKEDNLVQ